VLASGGDFPDGLSAATLAKKYNAPVLLTSRDSIPGSVLSELIRLHVTNVFITGGVGVVSKSVENQLNSLGITTERISGKDRYETSVKIAEKISSTSGEVIIANGYQWADALSVSPIAAKKGIPIILTDKDTLPSSVDNYLKENNFTKTYIIGDTDLISSDIENQLPNPQRITGDNDYERNINIIKTFENDIDFSNICIASGRGFADSISGSAFAAKKSSAIVLVDDSNLNGVTSQYTNAISAKVSNIIIFGLQGAVNDAIVQALFSK
jgi:putative cell wall-binding protein